MSYTSDGLERFGRYTKAESVGDVLRRARENYGLDVESVSQSLKIRPLYLQAIEDSRFEDLPGTAYAVGFVRSYADYLGLDSGELIHRFREEAVGATPQSELLVPQAQRERRFPGGAVLILSVVLAGVAYGGWYALSERDKVVVEAVPAVPAELLGEGDGPAPPARDATVAVAATVEGGSEIASATEPEGATPLPDAAATGSEATTPAPAAEPPAPAPEAAAQVAATTPTAPPPPAPTAPDPATPPAGFVPQGQVYGADNAGARIVILARLESWVRVSDGNQKPVWTRVLREGEAYQVPNDPGLTLTTGNAGGLEIYVDGQPIAPIGGVGMVSRNVPLDPAGLSGTAAAPTE